jgi:hypothetical protein
MKTAPISKIARLTVWLAAAAKVCSVMAPVYSPPGHKRAGSFAVTAVFDWVGFD